MSQQAKCRWVQDVQCLSVIAFVQLGCFILPLIYDLHPHLASLGYMHMVPPLMDPGPEGALLFLHYVRVRQPCLSLWCLIYIA